MNLSQAISRIRDWGPLPKFCFGAGSALIIGSLTWLLSFGGESPLGLLGVGIALAMGGVSISQRRRLERFQFLEANSDLFARRESLSQEGEDVIEWVTWGTKIICERATVARKSAPPTNRKAFLRDFGLLIDFVNESIPGLKQRGYRQLNHLLLCCRELSVWDEVQENEGREIVDKLAVHLGPRTAESTFASYVNTRLSAMRAIEREGFYDEAFDKMQFLYAVSSERKTSFRKPPLPPVQWQGDRTH